MDYSREEFELTDAVLVLTEQIWTRIHFSFTITILHSPHWADWALVRGQQIQTAMLPKSSINYMQTPLC